MAAILLLRQVGSVSSGTIHVRGAPQETGDGLRFPGVRVCGRFREGRAISSARAVAVVSGKVDSDGGPERMGAPDNAGDVMHFLNDRAELRGRSAARPRLAFADGGRCFPRNINKNSSALRY